MVILEIGHRQFKMLNFNQAVSVLESLSDATPVDTTYLANGGGDVAVESNTANDTALSIKILQGDRVLTKDEYEKLRNPSPRIDDSTIEADDERPPISEWIKKAENEETETNS